MEGKKLPGPPALRPSFYLRHLASILLISSPDNTFTSNIYSLAFPREPIAYKSVPCYLDSIAKIMQNECW